jgi:hypothetical protein
MNRTAFEPNIVEHIVNTLPPRYDFVHTYVIGLATHHSFVDISTQFL